MSKNTIKKWIAGLLVLSIIFSLIQPMNVQAAVKLNYKTLKLEYGATKKLKISGVKGKKIKWGSDDKSIATVDNKGTITAKGFGTTYVYAKVGKKIYSCKVIVNFNEKKCKKNIKFSYIRSNDFVIVKMKNENKYPINMSAEILFKDRNNVILDNREIEPHIIGSGNTRVAVLDKEESYDKISVMISTIYQSAESEEKDYSDKIDILSYRLDSDKITYTYKNKSNKRINSVNIICIQYDENGYPFMYEESWGDNLVPKGKYYGEARYQVINEQIYFDEDKDDLMYYREYKKPAYCEIYVGYASCYYGN